MNNISAERVQSFVLAGLDGPLAAKGLTPRDVPDDFDLLAQGVIDSLGIVEMISAVEEQFSIEVDFEDLDAEDLTIIGPFSRYIAEKSNGNRANR